MKKVYLKEQQFNYILEQRMLNEGIMNYLYQRFFGKCQNPGELVNRAIYWIGAGIISFAIAVDIIQNGRDTGVLSNQDAIEVIDTIAQQAPVEEWKPICNDAVVTVYNAKPEQCNSDVEHTASLFHLNLDSVGAHKIVALERSFMKEFGLKFGDVIKIVGTHKGLQDGVYQIQDVMNKRFAGQHKVDVLVPDSITHGGTWPEQYATIYVLNDKNNTQQYLDLMAPEYKKR
jgi:hypothetical protein